MADIVAIDRVRRAWEILSLDNQHGSEYAKFMLARDHAVTLGYPKSASVTDVEFFNYFNSIRRESFTPHHCAAMMGEGDFDDMGNGEIEAQYHYDQKKMRGRL